MARRTNRVRKAKQTTLPGLEYDGSTRLPDLKQELFCELYTSNSTPRFFGHGQNCYTFAYGFQERIDELQVEVIGADTRRGRGKSRKTLTAYDKIEREIKKLETTCRTSAARLLTYGNISARCNYLMDKLIEDKIVDRELAFVIQQRHDLPSKTSAIVHYDKKKGRLVERQESIIKFDPITAIEFVLPEKPVKK